MTPTAEPEVHSPSGVSSKWVVSSNILSVAEDNLDILRLVCRVVVAGREVDYDGERDKKTKQELIL